MMIITVLCMMSMLFFSVAAHAEETETDTDPLGMNAWKEYAEDAGHEIYYSNYTEADALQYFDCGELADSWDFSWELEGEYIQIFRYHFKDSDSAAAMFAKAGELLKESGMSESGRTEEEDYTILKMEADSGIWYMDFIWYGNDFFCMNINTEDGADVLDDILDNVWSSVEYTAYYDIAEAALKVLAESWNDKYWDEGYSDKEHLLDIRSTRIICIKDEDELEDTEADYFGDVQYIVEFLFYDDYMSYGDISGGQNAGYYQMTGIDNNVIVYDDGSMECSSNFIRVYVSRTYKLNYSDFIDQVIDLHERLNQLILFQNHEIRFEDQ